MLSLKSDGKRILAEMARLSGVAPLLAMMAAIVMLAMAVQSVHGFFEVKEKAEQGQRLPKFTLASRPVGKVAYERYAQVLAKVSPQVTVTASMDGLKISVPNTAFYPEFMYVLANVQGLSERVIWKAQTLCLVKCNGGAGTAHLVGFEEEISVSLRGESP